MIVRVGDIWEEEHKADVIFITTNCIVNFGGKLVMGRGAALEAASRYPLLAGELGKIIREKKYSYSNPYGLLLLPAYENGVQLGAFQVKDNWRDRASLDLIRLAASKLKILAEVAPHMRFVVNYPGIGNGQLTETTVYPYIKDLPDNVTVYKKRATSL